MTFIVLIAFAILLACCPKLRCAVCHPASTVYYGCKDIYYYFKHKEKNLYGTGELVAYVGLFGKGKPSPPFIRWSPPTAAMTASRSGVPGVRRW